MVGSRPVHGGLAADLGSNPEIAGPVRGVSFVPCHVVGIFHLGAENGDQTYEDGCCVGGTGGDWWDVELGLGIDDDDVAPCGSRVCVMDE